MGEKHDVAAPRRRQRSPDVARQVLLATRHRAPQRAAEDITGRVPGLARQALGPAVQRGDLAPRRDAHDARHHRRRGREAQARVLALAAPVVEDDGPGAELVRVTRRRPRRPRLRRRRRRRRGIRRVRRRFRVRRGILRHRRRPRASNRRVEVERRRRDEPGGAARDDLEVIRVHLRERARRRIGLVPVMLEPPRDGDPRARERLGVVPYEATSG
eukprot:31310-Pelagococcus_subviridis.AAC.11